MTPPLSLIQAAQTTLGQLQHHYRDTQIEFWGLAIAWDAARFAWYVVSGDLGTAAAKLVLLQEAIADYERQVDQLQREGARQ
jgi:hypothetical protein